MTKYRTKAFIFIPYNDQRGVLGKEKKKTLKNKGRGRQIERGETRRERQREGRRERGGRQRDIDSEEEGRERGLRDWKGQRAGDRQGRDCETSV